MKHTLLFFFAILLFTAHTKAQCTIDSSIQTYGFHPDTGSYLPKACTGSNYDAVVQIYAPQNVTIQLGTFPVNYVQLDSIPALPASLTYSTNPPNGKMNGGERGCINIYGAVTAPPGTYNFIIYYTANFTAFGGPISLPFQAPYKLVIDTGSPVFTVLPQTTICQGDFYNFNGRLLTTTGIYYDTLMSSSSHCDSIITLDLTVETIDTTVSFINGVLTAAAGYSGYQWYDCNAQLAIPNANSNTYTPTVAGSYAVGVDNGNCTVLTDCIQFTGVGDDLKEVIGLYPNPANNLLYVKTAAPYTGTARIFNSIGHLVLESPVNSGAALDISLLSKGLYHVTLTGGNTTGSRFVKQ
jgi:hypothetical protein